MNALAPSPLPVVLLAWKPLVKGALRGFASIQLGRSLKIAECPVLASNGRLWVALPGKPLVDRDGKAMLDARGKQRYSAILEWTDKAAADRFSEAVIGRIRSEHGPEALEPGA